MAKSSEFARCSDPTSALEKYDTTRELRTALREKLWKLAALLLALLAK